MIVVEVEIDKDRSNIKLAKKVLILTALYAQIAHSKETRHLVGEITLIDLARSMGVTDHNHLRNAASQFDEMLAERDWTFSVQKKQGELTWAFCNCGKEDCEGHDL